MMLYSQLGHGDGRHVVNFLSEYSAKSCVYVSSDRSNTSSSVHRDESPYESPRRKRGHERERWGRNEDKEGKGKHLPVKVLS